MLEFHANDQRIRYASAIAAGCGLDTNIEVTRCLYLDGKPDMPCHVWRGTADQFRQLWFMTPNDGASIDTIKKFRWLCLGWLRGHLYRDGPDAFRYVIEDGYGLTRQMENRISAQAGFDAGFQRFMKRLQMPVDCE